MPPRPLGQETLGKSHHSAHQVVTQDSVATARGAAQRVDEDLGWTNHEGTCARRELERELVEVI